MGTRDRAWDPEAVTDPTLIDDYIRISNPWVWAVLVLILCALAGALVWAMAGELDVTSPAYLVMERGRSTLWLGEADAAKLKVGDRFEAAGVEGVVVTVAGVPEPAVEVLGGAEAPGLGEWLCPFSVSVNLPAGTYPATVVLERYAPWELLFGGAAGGA